MTPIPEPTDDRISPEAAIDALLDQQARLAGDIVDLGHDTWALHATIPVDGDVILGEYGRLADAQDALDHLLTAQPIARKEPFS